MQEGAELHVGSVLHSLWLDSVIINKLYHSGLGDHYPRTNYYDYEGHIYIHIYILTIRQGIVPGYLADLSTYEVRNHLVRGGRCSWFAGFNLIPHSFYGWIRRNWWAAGGVHLSSCRWSSVNREASIEELSHLVLWPASINYCNGRVRPHAYNVQNTSVIPYRLHTNRLLLPDSVCLSKSVQQMDVTSGRCQLWNYGKKRNTFYNVYYIVYIHLCS